MAVDKCLDYFLSCKMVFLASTSMCELQLPDMHSKAGLWHSCSKA